MLCLQLILDVDLPLMQPTESVDFVLVLSSNLCLLSASRLLVFLRKLE
jgi:hypothetical protein